MGRDAGWVAASCTAAFGDNEQDLLPLLLLPERAPKSMDKVLQLIQQQIDDRRFSMVVVPETMRTSENKHFGGDEPEYVDSFGHPYFPSTGAALTRMVQQHLGVRARYDKPGTSARMSISLASPVDLDMAWELGAAAVEAMANGITGKMTALRRTGNAPATFDIELVPQVNIANRVRHLDEVFIGKDGHSVTPAYHEYLRPLLGDQPFPPYARFDEPVHVVGSEIPSLSRIREATMISDVGRGDLLTRGPEIGVDVNDGVDGTGVDAKGKVFPIRIGQDVLVRDGNKIGEVVDVRDDYLVVEKGFFNPEDIYVPKDQIESFDEYHLRLRLNREEAIHAGWEVEPDDAQ
jgi:6-phosphofructokinase 1